MPAWRGFPQNLLLDGWARWDAGWYAQIVDHGYMNVAVGPSGQMNVAFYPFYPLVVSILDVVVNNALLSTIIVSNLAALAAIILMYRLVEERFDKEVAWKSVLLLTVYPFSFYLSTGYSEALFLLLVVAAVYSAEKGKWLVAGLLGLFAAATRVPGLVLLPTLGLRYLESIDFRLRNIKANVLGLGLIVFGPLAFFAYLGIRFADPLIQFRATRVPGWWESGLNIPGLVATVRAFFQWRDLLTGAYPVVPIFNLFMAALFLASTIYVFKYVSRSWGVLSLLLIGFGFGQWIGWGRYVIAAFPVYVAWALILRKREAFEVVLIISSLLLALVTILYVQWYWVS